MVGGGEQEGALKRIAKTKGLDGHVTFTGRVPFEEVERYYDLIDIFVYPRRKSRLTDLVTPIKPLEAMAKARVVLASDCGGHREIVTHQQNGILFEAGNEASLADAIVSAVRAEPSWPVLGRAARDYVERERTWSASVANYAPVYEALSTRRTGRLAETQ